MALSIQWHHSVVSDLQRAGRAEARRVLAVLEEFLSSGSPGSLGKGIDSSFQGLRHFRAGGVRIAYQVQGELVTILWCTGWRR